MIKINITGGRFGNKMFNYAFSRILAEKFNFSLTSDLYPNNIIKNTPNPIGQSYETDPIIISDDNIQFEFPEKLDQKTYITSGYWQKYNYYEGNEDHIKTFFEYECPPLNKNDIALHVRLTDYKQFGKKGSVIHPDFYLKILKFEEYDKIYIITDEPNDKEYFKYFKKYNYELVSETARHDFYFLMSFNKMIISNSTFAWWAALLSNSSKIYTFANWLRNCNVPHRLENLRNARPIPGYYLDYN